MNATVRIAAAGLFAGAALLAGAARPTSVEAPTQVGLDVLHHALSGRPEPGGLMGDEVRFFQTRLGEREGDPLSHRKLAALSLLRFRAYNDPRELESAEDHVRVLEARYPTDSGVDGLRTTLELARHDFPAAMEAAQRSRRHARAGDEDARLRLFDAAWASGRYQAAQKLLEPRPEQPGSGYLAREARLLDRLGRTDDARERMESVVRWMDDYAQPAVTRAWARVELAHLEYHTGHPDRAVRFYREALDLVPADPAALEGLAWIAYGTDGQLAVAEALFLRSLRYGGHLDLYRELEQIARERGDEARARGYRHAFLQEARADPATERLFWRPLALLTAGEDASLPVALAYAERDLRQRQDLDAWAVRGWVLHRMGRTEEAVADMERALSFGVAEPWVQYRAGIVFLDAGHRARGRGLLKSALAASSELGPSTAADIRARLAG